MSKPDIAVIDRLTQTRLDALTGLRFFMAVWVFFHHTAQTSFGRVLTLPVISTVAETGYLAVGFFFVLSGFILTVAHSAKTSARVYAIRRIARIYPLYLLVIVVGIAWNAKLNHSASALGVVLGVLLLQSWWNESVVYYVGVPAAWSLSVEAFLYLVFRPAARRLHDLSDKVLLAIAGISLALIATIALALRLAHQDSIFWLYIFPPAHVLEFILGIVAAQLFIRGHRLKVQPVLLWTVALGLCVAVPHLPQWQTRMVLFAPMWPLLIFSLASSQGSIGAFLGSPKVKHLGEASFALYLVHGLVLLATFSIIKRLDIAQTNVSHSLSAVIVSFALLGSIVSSLVLFKWVERPAQKRLRRRLEPSSA